MYITSCAKKSAAATGPTDHVSHVTLSQHLLRCTVRCTAMHSVLKNLLLYSIALLENTGIFNVFINIIYIHTLTINFVILLKMIENDRTMTTGHRIYF